MSGHTHHSISTVSRRLPLAAGLAAAFALSASASPASDVHRPGGEKNKGHFPTTPHTVTTCVDDNSQSSLRTLVAGAGDGDTIQFALPAGCNTITLDPMKGDIEVTQPNLIFEGPGQDLLTIDANQQSRVIRHSGNGRLTINGLTIANGQQTSNADPRGGCIFSDKHVSLTDSSVTGCLVRSTDATIAANGGGIFAAGYLSLKNSSVTHNFANNYAAGGIASGGGVAALSLDFDGSTIANNYADTSGGGALLLGNHADIAGSTISSNHAHFVGGFDASIYNANADVSIVNSTISSNSAYRIAGLAAPNNTKIDNSTIAFNREEHYTGAGGVYAYGTLSLHSSIIAGNSSYSGSPSDLGDFFDSVTGDHNLITSSSVGVNVPMGTITECPHLMPLAANGGPTLTHALRYGSPAIDNGSNPLTLTMDQTLGPRNFTGGIDIGSVEWSGSPVDERIFIAGFDGLCDQ